MAFFGIFRKKAKQEEELDVPPLPPPIGFKAGEMPELPSLEEELPMPPSLEEVEAEAKKDEFPELPEEMPRETEEMPMLEEPKIEAYQEPKPAQIEMPRALPKREIREGKRPFFARMESFRNALESINDSKAALKHLEESAKGLGELDLSVERGYERWQSMLNDANRKLMFVEKNLFKGR